MVTWFTLPPAVTGAVRVKRRKGKAPPPLGSWRRGPTPCCAGRRRHRLPGAVLNPHLSTQRTLKTDAGRTLLLLVFQVLESGHVHWEPYLLYRKQQFPVACPALTGPEHPKYRASNSPAGAGPFALKRGSLCTPLPISVVLRPRQGPRQMQRGFSPIDG